MPKNALKSYHSHYYTLIVVVFRAVEGEHRMGFQNRRFLFLELYFYIQIKKEKKQKKKKNKNKKNFSKLQLLITSKFINKLAIQYYSELPFFSKT